MEKNMFRKTAVSCLLFVFFSVSLCASALNIGYAAGGNSGEDVEGFAASCLDTVFSLLPPSRTLSDINYARYIEESERQVLEDMHDDYASERENGESSPSAYSPYYEGDENFILIPVDAGDEFLSLRDPAMLEHVSRSDSLDLFFAFISSSEDGISSLDVYMYAGGKVTELYSSLYVDGTLEDELPSLMASVVSVLAPSSVLVDVRNFTNAHFFTDDDTELFPYSSWLLLPSSVTGVRISAAGYYDLYADIVPSEDGTAVIEGKLQSIPGGSITVTAHPYSADASLFAVDLPALPRTLSFESGALIMSVSAEGFESENLQITPGTSFYSVSLKPQWMAEDGRVRGAKEEMYTSLRNTILSFALYVAANSIANIYPQAAGWINPVGTISAGISVINLLDFIRDCFVYYDTARQVYM